MSKKKTMFEPYSQYAIIDLPVELCIQRALDLYNNNPLADAQLIHDEQLQIVYSLSDVDYSTVDATAMITRWQGTQTRVAIHIRDHAKKRRVPYVFQDPTRRDILIMLIYFGGLMYSLFWLKSALMAGVIFLAFIVSTRYFLGVRDSGALNKQVQAIWLALLDVLSSDDTGTSQFLVEEGESHTDQFEDYLTMTNKNQESVQR